MLMCIPLKLTESSLIMRHYMFPVKEIKFLVVLLALITFANLKHNEKLVQINTIWFN